MAAHCREATGHRRKPGSRLRRRTVQDSDVDRFPVLHHVIAETEDRLPDGLFAANLARMLSAVLNPASSLTESDAMSYTSSPLSKDRLTFGVLLNVGAAPEDVFDLTREQATAADHLGHDELWVTEHHFIRFGINPPRTHLRGLPA